MATQPQRTPAPAPGSTAYGIDDRPDQEVTPVVFVGGTGRSRHPHRRPPLRAPRAPLHDPGRVPLPRRGARLPGPARGRGHARTTSSSACAASGGAGCQTGRLRGMFKHLPRERFDAAVESFDAPLRRRRRGRLPAALLRPALAGGGRDRRPAARRAELRRRRRGADAGQALPGGALRPRRPRRPRRLRLARRPDRAA